MATKPAIAPPFRRSSFEPRALSPSASGHLDWVRALAAWTVMWGHLRALFFVDYPDVHNASRMLGLIYFATGFGRQSVMVFFVLSGFLITTSIAKKHAAGTWSLREYAIDRASRLYVVLIPGLLLGLLWDQSGRMLFSSSGLYSHPLISFGTIIAQDQLNLKTFLGNLLFLQTIRCATFGSNGPLWSLANEFWYYVLFPLMLIAAFAWRKRSLRIAIPATALAFGVAAFVGSGILSGFLIWLAGSALVLAYRSLRIRKKVPLILYMVISCVGLSACLVAVRLNRLNIRAGDLLIGLAFTVFLFGILQIDFGARHQTYTGMGRFFADFSYSLYVLHFPLLLFLRGWIAPVERWRPDAAHLSYGAMIGAMVVVYAWIVSVFTENKTRLVRNWMRNIAERIDLRSGRPQPSAAASHQK